MISVVMCAGLGDDGFDSPWTLELSGHATGSAWPPYLVVGDPVCQISFEKLLTPADPPYTGQYNGVEMPLAMLPSKERGLLRPATQQMIDYLNGE